MIMLLSYFWFKREKKIPFMSVSLPFNRDGFGSLLMFFPTNLWSPAGFFPTANTLCCLLLPGQQEANLKHETKLNLLPLYKEAHKHTTTCCRVTTAPVARMCERFLLAWVELWTGQVKQRQPPSQKKSELASQTYAANHISVTILHIQAATQIHLQPIRLEKMKENVWEPKWAKHNLSSLSKVIRRNHSHDWSTFHTSQARGLAQNMRGKLPSLSCCKSLQIDR